MNARGWVRTLLGLCLLTSCASAVPPASSASKVAFSPRPAPVRRVVRVLFDGRSLVPEEDLIGVLGVVQMDPYDDDSDVDEQLIKDELAVVAAYYDRGFLNVRVEPLTFAPSADGQFFDVVVRVKEGPRYELGTITIQEVDESGSKKITPMFAIDKLREDIALAQGATFARFAIGRGVAAMATRYRDLGYARVAVKLDLDLGVVAKLSPDRTAHVANIDLSIMRGQIMRISDVVVRGTVQVGASEVRKELGLQAGEQFNETKLLEGKRRVQKLGLFEGVDVSTEDGPDPDRVVINVDVVERPGLL